MIKQIQHYVMHPEPDNANIMGYYIIYKIDQGIGELLVII